jgi:4-hydroxy-tetrahydrodipicolinate reductase
MAKAIEDYIFQFQIEKVRDPTEQIQKMGVPEEYLGGHAFHTYSLTSPDHT